MLNDLEQSTIQNLTNAFTEYRDEVNRQMAELQDELNLAVHTLQSVRNIMQDLPHSGDYSLLDQLIRTDYLNFMKGYPDEQTESKESFRQSETPNDGTVFHPYAFPPLRVR